MGRAARLAPRRENAPLQRLELRPSPTAEGWCAILTSLAETKLFLRIDNPSQDQLLLQLIPVADRMVKLFCKQNLESRVQTEPLKGQGTPQLWTRQKPILCYSFTGTLVSGSPVVTGLVAAEQSPGATTGNLLVGMPALIGCTSSQQSALPNRTTILTVDSATQVTLSAPAAASGPFPLTFGLAVWYSPVAYSGDSPSGFPANSQLVLGVDYGLDRDQSDGTSKSGLLTRLGGGVTGAAGFGWPWNQYRQGSLTTWLPPVWPQGYGNVRCIYGSGYGIGAPDAHGPMPADTTLPPELTWCVNTLVGWARTVVPVGIPLESKTFVDSIGEAMSRAIKGDPEMGTLRSVMRSFRDVSL